MKFMQKSFTALGSESNTYTHARAVCRESGHMETDLRGKCLRCGEKVLGLDLPNDAEWAASRRRVVGR
jgi:hypothetical protein